jgi:hypothetical protein
MYDPQFIPRLEVELGTLPLTEKSTQILDPKAFRCLVSIVSPDFETMDEADRQSLVWGHLNKTFTWEELSQIEFIFTDSPAERLAAETASS